MKKRKNDAKRSKTWKKGDLMEYTGNTAQNVEHDKRDHEKGSRKGSKGTANIPQNVREEKEERKG